MTEPDDRAEIIRKFETICRVALSTGRSKIGSGRRLNQVSLSKLGAEFGLTKFDVGYCKARASNQLMASHRSGSLWSYDIAARLKREIKKAA